MTRPLFLAITLLLTLACDPRPLSGDDKFSDETGISCGRGFFQLPEENFRNHNAALFAGITSGYEHDCYGSQTLEVDTDLVSMEGCFGLLAEYRSETWMLGFGQVDSFTIGDIEGEAFASYEFSDYYWCEDGAFVGSVGVATYNFLFIGQAREAEEDEEYVYYGHGDEEDDPPQQVIDLWILDGTMSSSLTLEEHIAILPNLVTGTLARAY
jgi:hypothetical protein